MNDTAPDAQSVEARLAEMNLSLNPELPYRLEKMFPKLEAAFGGGKLNVPVPDVSCADLVLTLRTEVRPSDVAEVFRSASGSTLQGILDYTEEPIVSSDIVGSTASCTFDSQATLVMEGSMLKILGWYEQGGGLANRIVDVISQLGPQRVQS